MAEQDDKDRGVADTQTEATTDNPSDLGPSSAIGKRLRAYYDDVASEPVPDRFLSLLDALDAAELKSKNRG